MNCKSMLAALFVCLMSTSNLCAQDSEFDLSSQRKERQDVQSVPGHKVDHNGIIVNPTPQAMSLNRNKTLNISNGVKIIDKKNKFSADLSFISANPKGTKLTIDINAKAAKKAGVKAVSGGYSLTINAKGINIVGFDERGAFYGIQTLRQLIESPAVNGALPYATITDYPSLPFRGVVEGFYGTPWSHEVRKSLIEFYGKFKLNTYLYGPKDDPYHSSPNWRLPYPEKEAANIKELVEVSNANRVDFVWAIHPGKDIKWNEEDYKNLVNKFNMMYDLGVRSFAVFFDDIEGEGTNPNRQTELLNRLNSDFVKAKGDVQTLTVCPTDYSKLWANPTPNGSLAIYGNTLDPSVKVFWTGDVVCSDLTPETMDWLNSRIKRPGYFWWNYPVTDYVRHIIMQGPVYGLNTSLTDKDLCGFISNPMEHGEASKLALYSVADYSWNIANYNPIDSWERGLAELVPDATEAYRTFAIHSCDTENGYRRDESWETATFKGLNEWNDQIANSLWAEYDKVANVPAQLEAGCNNELLKKELRPWLAEFGKLGIRGKKAIELALIYRSGEHPEMFWNKYVDNLMTEEDAKAYLAHKCGTMKLQPFYENLMDDMGFGFLVKQLGYVPQQNIGTGSWSTCHTTQTKLMFDNDSTTHFTSGAAQKPNSWIGVDLGSVIDVHELEILQGRNSVDDVDYFDHVQVEYSADGKTWTAITKPLKKQYIINWKGDVKARYVRLKRLESKKTNYAAVRVFNVNPIRLDNIGFSIDTECPRLALRAFDKRIDTSYKVEKDLTFGIKEGAKQLTMLANKGCGKCAKNPIKLIQLAADGSAISTTTITSPYTNIALANGVAKVKIQGAVEIFELIVK